MPAQSNITLGREVELYERVRLNDPTDAVLVALVLASPAELLSVLKTYETVEDLLLANPEVTNTNYARIELASGDLAAPVVNHAANILPAVLPLLTWDAGGGPDAGDAWDYCVIAYDGNSGTGGDADLIPVTFHELRIGGAAVVPNGSPIVHDLTEGWVTARQYP